MSRVERKCSILLTLAVLKTWDAHVIYAIKGYLISTFLIFYIRMVNIIYLSKTLQGIALQDFLGIHELSGLADGDTDSLHKMSSPRSQKKPIITFGPRIVVHLCLSYKSGIYKKMRL